MGKGKSGFQNKSHGQQQQQRRTSAPHTPLAIDVPRSHCQSRPSHLSTPEYPNTNTPWSPVFAGNNAYGVPSRFLGQGNLYGINTNMTTLTPFSSTSYTPSTSVGLLPPASLSELRHRTQQLIDNAGVASRLSNGLSTIHTPQRTFPLSQHVPYSLRSDEMVVRQTMNQIGLGGIYSNAFTMYGQGGDHTSTIQHGPLSALAPSTLLSPICVDGGFAASRSSSRDSRDAVKPQSPSRTLWVGNLDVQVTKGVVYEVFEQYGPIESIRMLPEKTCAFVNFFSQSGAVHAREDVLHKMGGIVPSLSRTAPVRVSFGNSDLAMKKKRSSEFTSTSPRLQSSRSPNELSPYTPWDRNRESNSTIVPTRAIRIDSIPESISCTSLSQIFASFGAIENSRILPGKRHGFINFEHLDSAVAAYDSLNGKELFGSYFGPIRIYFARVPTRATSGMNVMPASSAALMEALHIVDGAISVPMEKQVSKEHGGVENYRSPLLLDLLKKGIHEKVLEKGLDSEGTVSEKQMIIEVFSRDEDEDGGIYAKSLVNNPERKKYQQSISELQTLPMEAVLDIFKSQRLKKLASELSENILQNQEVLNVCKEYFGHYAQLSIHPLGNTILQHLFKLTSPDMRILILEQLAPYLASIAVHRHGTWTVQAFIENASIGEEREIIVNALREWAPALMRDKAGNYACSAAIAFGSKQNAFVFDAAVDQMLEIAQDRYGARCLVRCLESQHTSLFEKKRVASTIVLNSIPLITSANGTILVAWLLDSAGLPGRYELLTKRFLPHLPHLCNHRIASAIILKIISQKVEPEAAQGVTSGIFQTRNDFILLEILNDTHNGLQFVGKVLTLDTFTRTERNKIEEAIRRTLPSIPHTRMPEYHLLAKLVGLYDTSCNNMFNKTIAHAASYTTIPPVHKQTQEHQSRHVHSQTIKPKQFSTDTDSSASNDSCLQHIQQKTVTNLDISSQDSKPEAPWYEAPLLALPTPKSIPIRISRPITTSSVNNQIPVSPERRPILGKYPDSNDDITDILSADSIYEFQSWLKMYDDQDVQAVYTNDMSLLRDNKELAYGHEPDDHHLCSVVVESSDSSLVDNIESQRNLNSNGNSATNANTLHHRAHKLEMNGSLEEKIVITWLLTANKKKEKPVCYRTDDLNRAFGALVELVKTENAGRKLAGKRSLKFGAQACILVGFLYSDKDKTNCPK
nr:hypothetical protein L204_05403 [Cryptococcus depauperatus CBS 7855]